MERATRHIRTRMENLDQGTIRVIIQSMYQIFYVGTRGIICNGDKVLLLEKRDHIGIMWDLPGGRVDENEWDMKSSLERELREELPSISNFSIKNCIHNCRFPRNLEDGTAYWLFFFPVTIPLDTKSQIEITNEHLSAKWFSYQELKSLPDSEKSKDGYLYPCYKEAIRKTINEKLTKY